MKIKPVQILSHIILLLGVLLMVLPIWYSFATSTHENISIMTEGMKFFLGDYFDQNYKIAGDYEFLLRFYKFEKFHFINKELLESTIGGLSEYSIKAQIEGMKAKTKHKTRNIFFIYKDTFFIILKILIKKIIYKSYARN